MTFDVLDGVPTIEELLPEVRKIINNAQREYYAKNRERMNLNQRVCRYMRKGL